MEDDVSDKTDAAALGAGVVAVAMTVFGDPSVYDLLTVIVSAALMVLVLGYVARSRRDRLQSLGFAAVVTMVTLPILGYAVEGRPGPWAKPPPPSFRPASRPSPTSRRRSRGCCSPLCSMRSIAGAS